MTRMFGLAFLLAVALTACGPAEPPAAPDPDPGVGHVHGLGVDPASGRVYVAGHFGLFTLDGGRLARVGDRDADHMGFTVAGPGTFYASGHPAAGDIRGGQAPHLGLIRSADAGATWEQVALAGRADFHALVVTGGTVYGYDSQTGQVWRGSDGGRDLKPAARLDLLDLAAGAETVYATTPDGVRVSTDGARSFTPLKGAPLLSFLDVTGADRLTGVAPDGRVQRSADGGRTWQAGGKLPMQAVAFTAVSADRLLAASMDGTVYESTDAGATFAAIWTPS